MFGKPEWFERRKYGGWGLMPKTKEGWLYVLAIVIPFIILQELSFLAADARTALTAGWALFICFDVLDMMLRMKKDERETLHEAIAERNAAWVMVTALALGAIYEATASSLAGAPYVDPILVAVLFAGLAAKAITNWKLSKEN
ncbi:MAG: hypothetical protein WCY41_03590 [Candidatus Micrarchaeia archaeon]